MSTLEKEWKWCFKIDSEVQADIGTFTFDMKIYDLSLFDFTEYANQMNGTLLKILTPVQRFQISYFTGEYLLVVRIAKNDNKLNLRQLIFTIPFKFC